MTTVQKIIKYLAIAFAVFLVVTIIGGIIGVAATLTNLFGGGVQGEMKSHPITAQVQSLDVDVGAADLEIRTGEQFSLESNHKYLRVQQKDGTLRISEERHLWGFTSGGAKIILTVPQGFTFQSAKITTGAGRLTADTLTANRLDLELGAGAVEIGSLTATERAQIEGGAGKVSVKGGALASLELDMGVGALELTSRLTGRCQLDYGVGETRLTLLGSQDDYTIELDKGVGEATLDGRKIEGGVHGAGENKIDIDGGVGAIHIGFQN